MGCNCKDNIAEIQQGMRYIAELRELFIKRMSEDSATTDRRKREYNQAIFKIRSKEEVDSWNSMCEKYGLDKREYGTSYAVWSEMDMDMVLRCFDDAVKDWRRTWCDVDHCRRR